MDPVLQIFNSSSHKQSWQNQTRSTAWNATPMRAHPLSPPMTEFDPDKFEDKYVHYFTELQRAYKDAFEVMNDTYDSELVHAIDQLVLSESEPFYDEQDGFVVECPDNAFERVQGMIIVDEQKFNHVLNEFVDAIEAELATIFDM